MNSIGNIFKTKLALGLFLITTNLCYAQTVKTVGTSGDYPTLSSAFNAVNSGSLTGQLEFKIISSFTETATATLSTSGSGGANYTSVLIYPTVPGVIISANLSGGLIVLDGADNVTIDGRVNQTCGIDLTIENISTTSTIDNNTIRLQNSSENNVFRYIKLKGSNPYHSDAQGINPSGSIFRFAGSTNGNGNDNNKIENCHFTSAGTIRPSSAVYSEGSAGFENSENHIKNCEFYNHLKTNPLDITSSAICVYSNSTNFTIQGNSFYETTSFGVQSGTPTTNGYSYIFVRNFPSGYVTIKDNYIGGSAPNCAGNPLFFTSSNSFPKNYNLRGINVIAGNTNLSLIENNTIKNFTMEKTNYQNFGQFIGIYIQDGWCNVLNNTIGSQNETSIILDNASTSSLSNSRSCGIEYRSCVSQDCHISGNNISGIICKRTGDPIYNHSFNGLLVTAGCSTPGNIFIRNNQIGSPNMINSILCEPIGGNAATLKQELLGIISNINSKSVFIDSNRIENLTNLTSASSELSICGIQCMSAFATFSVNHNLIQNLTSYSSAVWDGTPNLLRVKPVMGIWVWQTQTPVAPKTQFFRNNSISNLKNLNTSNFPADVVGIFVFGKNATDVVNNFIEKNYISDLTVAPENTNSGSKIAGIFIDNAGISATNNIPSNPNFTNNINNNVITVGQTVNSDLEIYGIYDGNINGNSGNFNFNTIVLGGSSPSGAVAKTYCVYRPATTNGITNYSGTKTFQNNIFYNNRSVASGNNTLHHSAQIQFTSGLTMNYNDHWTTSTGSGNFLAQLGNISYQSLSTWQTALSGGLEQNSLNLDPQFVNNTGGTLLSYTKATVMNGLSGTGITVDALDSTRNTIPQMGAIENGVPVIADADNDGYNFDVDCNDSDAAIFPGALDSADGIDNDCDGAVDEDAIFQWYYSDMDNDGFGTGTGVYATDSPGANYALVDGDCNDNAANIHPNANEDCTDGIDNNCNCIVDESTSQVLYFTDSDNDGYGSGSSQSFCSDPGVGYAQIDGDCDDNDFDINPDALEICDGIDNNCDGNIDEGLTQVYYFDADGDGYGAGDPLLLCPNPEPWYVTQSGDCDDNDAMINPDALEICDGIDNNCDGSVDESLFFADYYVDADGDGFGVGTANSYCADPGVGYSLQDGDCNDNSSTIFPNATDIPNNGIDENCDGVDGNLSLDEVVSEGIRIKPNPITDYATFTYAGDTEGVILTIVSMNGEMLRKIAVTGKETIIEKDHLTSGVYFVKVYKNGEFIGVLKMSVL